METYVAEEGAIVAFGTGPLLGEMIHPDPGLWFFSFRDPSLPTTAQYLGGAVVEADGPALALARTHELGCNPGGQAVIIGPLPTWSIDPEWQDRLLTRDEALGIPDPGL